jgi:hypothetical protein
MNVNVKSFFRSPLTQLLMPGTPAWNSRAVAGSTLSPRKLEIVSPTPALTILRVSSPIPAVLILKGGASHYVEGTKGRGWKRDQPVAIL